MCSHGERYISTKDTSPSEGALHVIIASYSIDNLKRYCHGQCQSDYDIKPQELCYGFSVNQNTHSCSLYFTFDQQLGVIGGSPGVDFFRRILYCSKSNLTPLYYYMGIHNIRNTEAAVRGSQCSPLMSIQPEKCSFKGCIDGFGPY